MRQTHAAGERLFVDYASDGVPVVIDRSTSEMRKAQIFVAVLGTSSFTDNFSAVSHHSKDLLSHVFVRKDERSANASRV